MRKIRDLDRRVLGVLCSREGEFYSELREQIPFLSEWGFDRSGIGYHVAFLADSRAVPTKGRDTVRLFEVHGVSPELTTGGFINFEVIVANGLIFGIDAVIGGSDDPWPKDEGQISVLTQEQFKSLALLARDSQTMGHE